MRGTFDAEFDVPHVLLPVRRSDALILHHSGRERLLVCVRVAGSMRNYSGRGHGRECLHHIPRWRARGRRQDLHARREWVACAKTVKECSEPRVEPSVDSEPVLVVALALRMERCRAQGQQATEQLLRCKVELNVAAVTETKDREPQTPEQISGVPLASQR